MNTPKRNLGWALRGIAANRCPRCANADIFRYGVVMRAKCSSCGYVYERENGYFLGAMVIGYFMCAFSTVPTMVLGVMVLHADLFRVLVVGCSQVILLTPLIFRYSRLAWIYLDFRADPDARDTGGGAGAGK